MIAKGRNDEVDREDPIHNKEVAIFEGIKTVLEMTSSFYVMLLRKNDKYARLHTGLPSWRACFKICFSLRSCRIFSSKSRPQIVAAFE
jgi:hypothetical protein